jgi:hypothetical protein
MAGRTTQTGDQQARHYLSPQQFSAHSGLSLSTVHRYLRQGRLPFRQPAGRRGRVLIPRDALEVLTGDTLSQDLDQGATPPPTAAPAQPPVTPTRLPGPRPKWTRKAGPSPDKES